MVVCLGVDQASARATAANPPQTVVDERAAKASPPGRRLHREPLEVTLVPGPAGHRVRHRERIISMVTDPEPDRRRSPECLPEPRRAELPRRQERVGVDVEHRGPITAPGSPDRRSIGIEPGDLVQGVGEEMEMFPMHETGGEERGGRGFGERARDHRLVSVAAQPGDARSDRGRGGDALGGEHQVRDLAVLPPRPHPGPTSREAQRPLTRA